MSNHVGSRWYRAPEICLLEKQYDSASDIWSLGCTVSELVRGMTFSQNYDVETTKVSSRLLALFPGDSCYPISPKYKEKEKQDIVSPNDQLIFILKELKERIEERDFSFILTDDPRKYAEHLTKDVKEKCKDYGKGNITAVKGIDKSILEALESMVEFNPYFRTSATEAIHL